MTPAQPISILQIADQPHSQQWLYELLVPPDRANDWVIEIAFVPSAQVEQLPALIGQRSYDIILLDWQGQVDEMQIRQLHQAATHIPLVVITEEEDEQIFTQFQQAGAAECLVRRHLTPYWLQHALRRVLLAPTPSLQLIHHSEMTESVQLAAAEKDEAEKNETYQRLFDNMPEGLALLQMIYDEGRPVDYLFLNINATYESMLGIKKQDRIGKKASEISPFADLLGTLHNVDTGGKPIIYETYTPQLKRYYDVSVFPVQEKQVAVLFSDTTKRKKTEQALRESEARYRAFAHAAANVFFRMSADGTEPLEIYNGDLHQHPHPQEPIPHLSSLLDYIHPDDKEMTYAAWTTAIATHTPFELEHRRRFRDGSWGWVLSRAIPVRNEVGEIVEWVGSVIDISARKQAEEELRQLNETLERRVEERTQQMRQSEERFRALVDASSQIVWTTDAQGSAVEDSPSWRAFTGQSYDEWHGWGWLEAVHPDDRERIIQLWRTSVENKTPLDIEFRICHVDGGWRWMHVRAVPLHDESGAVRGWVGMNNDISERKQEEQARIQLIQRIVTTQEEERRRIARELHDSLGQYLTAIHIGLKAVQEQDGCPPHITERIEQLRAIAFRMDEEVEMLSYELRPQALDDLGLVDALHRHIDEWSALNGIAVDFHTQGLEHERLPVMVETVVYRIVQEALTNILKHAEATHVSLIVERRSEVQIIIEDNGRGFAQEVTLDAPRAARRLGLVGMKERAELVGGHLDIETEAGVGTTIYLHLPVDPAPSDKPHNDSSDGGSTANG
jgi:PAS domain S-box-containing protein